MVQKEDVGNTEFVQRTQGILSIQLASASKRVQSRQRNQLLQSSKYGD